MEQTKDNSAFVLTLSVNYGGRDEIVRAAQKIINEKLTTVSENILNEHLDTAGMPDVDLVIRTGGHHRLSNFLLWQAAYAELYFTDTKWPGFGVEELDQTLAWFQEQQRNRGK